MSSKRSNRRGIPPEDGAGRPAPRSSRPAPDDTLYALGDTAALAHELRGLVDGSRRWIGLAQRSLSKAKGTERAGSLDDATRQLAAAAQALDRMAGVVHASMQSALPIGSSLISGTEPVTIGQAAAHAVDLLARESPLPEAEAVIELDDEASELPAGALYAVLANGVRNAFEAVGAAPPGRHRISVSVRAARERGRGRALVIEIGDTGVGPPRGEPASRLLQPGFSTKGSGRGMGLAICDSIVAGMGGTLALGPRPKREGGGSLLRITIPWPRPAPDVRIGRASA